jgi:hypothetical protein
VNKKAVERQLLEEVLSSYEKRRFSLEEKKHSFKVTAATFRDLNCLANLVFTSINFIPVVLPPERLFLLEKGWSYFDCFTFHEEQPVKSGGSALPAVLLPFFSEPVPETVAALIKSDRQQAEKILESVVLSNALCMPFDALPPSRFLQVEALFENLFQEFGFNRQRKHESQPQGRQTRLSLGKEFTELDMSRLWPLLLSKPIYNLGFDSIDCGCCRPDGISSANILPNSTAVVEIQREAFYFQSLSRSFSQEFHKNHPESRESRVRRMMEYCLPSLPAGPFSRGEKAVVPLADAMTLVSENSARIISMQETHWFCKMDESLLSKGIALLSRKTAGLESSLESMRSGAVAEHGILGASELDCRPDYLFQQCSLEICGSLLSLLVPQLANERSAFFSRAFAESVATVQARVLQGFAALAEQNHGKIVPCQGGAFVKTDRPLSLISEFSAALNVSGAIEAKIKARKRE